jgi:hypothetical protein
MSVHIQCTVCSLQCDADDLADADFQMMLHLFVGHPELLGTEFMVGTEGHYGMIPADRGKLTVDQLGRLAEFDATIGSL